MAASRIAPGRDQTTSDEVLALMGSLWELFHSLRSYSRRMHRTIGVTGPQRLLLRVLSQAGGMASPGELAEALHVDPSTLTGVLKRLQSAKLIVRSVHPVDRRRAIIALTPKGKGLSGQRIGTVEEAVRSMLRTLAPGERAVVQRAIAALAKQLTPGERRRD